MVTIIAPRLSFLVKTFITEEARPVNYVLSQAEHASSSERAMDQPTDVVIHLFEEHHVAVFNYLRRVLNDDALAMDLTQETFLRVLDAVERLNDVRNPRAWVFRIATNLAFNALKRKRRFAWLPLFGKDQVQHQQQFTEGVHRRLVIERALARLPAEQRSVLLLYAYYGFRVREIAEMMDLSESAVKMRLYRARERLREVLREMGEEP